VGHVVATLLVKAGAVMVAVSVIVNAGKVEV